MSKIDETPEGKKKRKDRASWARRKQKDPTAVLAKLRKYQWVRLGMDTDAAEALFQGRIECGICGCTDKTALQVDHCHLTGTLRGTLCGKCNKGIGLLGDTPDLVLKAAEYLMKAAW